MALQVPFEEKEFLMVQNKIMLRFGMACCAVSRFFHRASKKKNILFIKDDGLGDLIFWLPYQQEIRRHFPESKYCLTVFPKKNFVPLLEAANISDQILKFPAYRNKLQWTLFRIYFWLFHSYDLICDVTAFPPNTRPPYGIFHPYKESFFAAVVSKMSLPGPDNLKGQFKHVINISNATIHERYQAILNVLGISAVPRNFDYRRFCAPFSEMPEAEPFFAVCIGSKDPKRNWEKEKYIELINLLQAKYALTAVLVGSKEERKSCEEVRLRCADPTRIKNFAGQTSVLQLFTVIRGSRFLISNETGICHIGGVLGVQTFIICGFGDYGSFVPYPKEAEGKTVHSIFSSKRTCKPCAWQNEQCRKQPVYPCISDITVDEVFNTVCSRFASKN